MEPVFDMLGERALLVTLSRDVSVEANDRVLRLSQAIEDARVPGVSEAQPAYSSLCVHFDPESVRASYIEGLVRQLMEETESAPDLSRTPVRGPRQVEIPVVYGGEDGPDLQWSAQYLGISTEELVRRHTSRSYRVFMVGFTPGFPYLGGMDEGIALPRLPEPRAKVPAGSVGIGGSQTGVYPWVTPGGWRLLGRTGAELFSPHREDPSLLHAGDTVRFVPVGRGQENRAFEQGLGGEAGAHGVPGSPGGSFATARAATGCAAAGPAVVSLEVEHAGFLTMVVDEGRFGFRKLGVPVSGAADFCSYRLANRLCGNAAGEAALEMTLLGAKIRARVDLTVAVTGAPAPVSIDGRQVPMDRPLFLPAGSLLELGSFQTGCRAYLAVAGGIKVQPVMGSRSTYVRGRFGGYQGRFLKAGDILLAGPAPEHSFILAKSISAGGNRPGLSDALNAPELKVRVVPGPESEPALLDALCSDPYQVSLQSDRMGLRFAGRVIPIGQGDILSSPVVPGSIEVPSDGKPLLLLCDAQTSGGYKRVATVITEDLPLAGQLRPGAWVAFRVAGKQPVNEAGPGPAG